MYEIKDRQLVGREPVDFSALNLWERRDLQALLFSKVDVLDAGLKVVAQEYGNWEDARRRLDILAVDRDGHLVVIELKRTSDGGHADLQALRYAAMISTLTFDDVVAAYSATLATPEGSRLVAAGTDPRDDLREFLGVPDGDDISLQDDVRIMLVSADFGRELTTAVLWLNKFDGMDIRCIRLRPYDLDGRMLLGVDQIIPLPEATDFQVRQRRKAMERERASADNRDWTRYVITVNRHEFPPQNKRNSIRVLIESLISAGIDPEQVAAALPNWALRKVGPSSLLASELPSVVAAATGTRADRYFLNHPIEHNGATWVVSKGWGGGTVEPALERLVTAFPNADASFRIAD